jgi:Ca2+-binding RTX toxin-like protein
MPNLHHKRTTQSAQPKHGLGFGLDCFSKGINLHSFSALLSCLPDEMRLLYMSSIVIGKQGSDHLTGTTGNDLLIGQRGNDTLIAGAGNDVLIGGAGNDSLNGGIGNDRYVFAPNFGQDTLVDGDGVDTLDLSSIKDNINFDGWAAKLTAGHNSITWDINVTRIENIVSGSGNDTIVTLDENNLIDAGAGNDTALTGSGTDIIYGGAGNDSLDGGQGNDLIFGGQGNDTLIGNGGNDTVYGDQGNDVFMEWSATGSDAYYGGAGRDTVDYSTSVANTWFYVGASKADSDHVLNNGDIDTLDSIEVIQASTTGSDNRIIATDSASGVSVNLTTGAFHANNSDVEQVLGFRNINGSAYADTLIGNELANEISGDAGNDVIRGQGGDDFLYGDAGNDTLDGGTGNDGLVSGSGNDTLIGGHGDDTLIGGTGNDTYLFTLGDGRDLVVEQDATPGNMDRLVFDNSIKQAKIALFQTANGDLQIGYTNSTSDLITIQGQASASGSIERLELSNGHFMTSNDVNQVIQTMANYANTHGISLTSLDDVKNHADLMTIVNAGWHS